MNKINSFRSIFFFVSALLFTGYCLAVSVAPSELTFDCNPIEQQSAEQLNIESVHFPERPHPKDSIRTTNFEFSIPEQTVIRGEEIEQQLHKDGFADVIVTLQYDHIEIADSGKTLPEKVHFLQDRLMGTPAMNSAVINRLYSNIPAVHLQIDSEALELLKECEYVAAVEPLMMLETNTAQGVPLMGADVYRPIYGGAGVSVAILDTGIDYNHPALGNGGFPNSKVIGGYNFGDGNSNPMAGGAHGTNCAGLAAGDIITSGDYIGGVAPDAKLYALKVMEGSSGTTDTSKLVSAIDWCVTHQFDDPDNPILVISLSLGSGRYTNTCNNASSAFTNAVNSAVSAGITVLSSSGNDGYCDAMGFPACISNVISVGAVFDASFGSRSFCLDEDSCIGSTSTSCPSNKPKLHSTSSAADKVVQYSNSSSLVDVLAPAHNASTTTNGGGYTTAFGGTSAACAYAAGAVAALQSAAADIIGRFLDPSEVRSFLADKGDEIEDWKNNVTTARINLVESIELMGVFSGKEIVISNSSNNRSANIESITYPSWISIFPEAPFSVSPNSQESIYVTADCGFCDQEDFAGDIVISGSRFPNVTINETVLVEMLCPQCLLMANLTEDCNVNLFDFKLLSDCWLSTDSSCEFADITGSGMVDLADLEIMASEWLESN